MAVHIVLTVPGCRPKLSQVESLGERITGHLLELRLAYWLVLNCTASWSFIHFYQKINFFPGKFYLRVANHTALSS